MLTRSTLDYISEYVGYKARRVAGGLSTTLARANRFYWAFHLLDHSPLSFTKRFVTCFYILFDPKMDRPAVPVLQSYKSEKSLDGCVESHPLALWFK